jgi:hypothetical protein
MRDRRVPLMSRVWAAISCGGGDLHGRRVLRDMRSLRVCVSFYVLH